MRICSCAGPHALAPVEMRLPSNANLGGDASDIGTWLERTPFCAKHKPHLQSIACERTAY